MTAQRAENHQLFCLKRLICLWIGDATRRLAAREACSCEL